MNIIIFEDTQQHDFFPISLTRPVWDIRCGLFTLQQRFDALFPSSLHDCYYYTRHYLQATASIHTSVQNINVPASISTSAATVFINARIVYPQLSHIKPDTVYYHNNMPMMAMINNGEVPPFYDSDDVNTFLLNIAGKGEYNGFCISSMWDLVSKNEEIIKQDFRLIKNDYAAPSGVTIIGDSSQLIIEDDVAIDPFVVIDCTKGPVHIARGCTIKAFTVIEGPCGIGENTTLLQAKVRCGCSIGPWCRIGGEIEHSIFQGWANKYHEGFIGHSYIGQWVNVGALTTNSDLKNNYTGVKVVIGDEKINTGLLKVGCFIGDYTMTSIGTLIDTGSVMGPGCIIVHDGKIAPKFIPPFSWYIGDQIVELPSEEKFMAACKTMMSRRDRQFTNEHRMLLHHIREQSKDYRKGIGKWNVPR